MPDIDIQDLKSQLKSKEEINKQYTDLKSQLKSKDEINKQYTDSNWQLKSSEALKIYPTFNTVNKDLNGEKFEPLEINGITRRIKLEVSNLGRIRYNDEILHQVEEVKKFVQWQQNDKRLSSNW